MFVKYPHLERYGNQPVEGIDFGLCHIFPKLDGTNASVWYEDGKIICGSRNRQLNWKLSAPGLEITDGDKQSDNAGFALWMKDQTRIHDFLDCHMDLILYGEWLVPHTIKNYRDDAWRKFYVFDVYDKETEMFLPYDTYAEMLGKAGISYLPCLQTINNPTEEMLRHAAKHCTYLMKDGEVGEGIVIKNYNWKNKHGQVTWAKIVNSEFKEQHLVTMGSPHIDNVTNAELIAEKVVTSTLVEKEYAKIVTEAGGWNNRLIPRLLHTVYYCAVTEELWDCLKLIKNGSVNFKELQAHCINKVKQLKPEIFS